MFSCPRPALRDCGLESFASSLRSVQKDLCSSNPRPSATQNYKKPAIPFGHISFFILVEVARIELASKEETYFRLRDVVHLDTIPLKNKQKTEKSGLNCPFSSTN